MIADFFEEPKKLTHPIAEIMKHEGARVVFRYDKNSITAVKLIEDISMQAPIMDFSLEETKIDDIIRLAYQGAAQ
ncbi:hypothetical protein RBG61_04965 [Paludicola sp. MB14-C6]|uniref:hypothetical protein n=1 Tax=Paludihabitans sp. MB14-C6 TaxID=3070656 RepID=UPI0027DCD141|nr:hypothetical protein [Paludicola sp. MB14-C6]WMJ24024.1 hypothetical protein RBG61_04965 [Paludicola sp. MB14-C6]